MAQLLTPEEINTQAAGLTGWVVAGNSLKWEHRFVDFLAAMKFVNSLVEPAEQRGHHPDIFISYNRVVVTLTTHDAGGLTQKDFDLAQQVNQLHSK
ncbi:pterin-4-alpha-carbinolamine dehydratase [Gloeomargarita lithophora Alchichica-D10]|uniref:Putative pterin-4-alpha-carbinolamine dehydratase n=1 Tax=Gloeomargarita lithophora Alchichica-D10 TaxID=1188229 RepID=A0A1J0AFL4_9CYAN|nr:4a-hydroxytetrahydrobiopterin dehydratase [Gloeomargarita lithophora]APB34691.1 pterin-4-alpha-carbinolamine dehydratase [Gloeomargarita lithophora Alchichica-D10]